MSELNVLYLLDGAISSVRDTESHIVQYGEYGCDGEGVGVLYDEIECIIHESSEVLQAKFDKLTADNKRLIDLLSECIENESGAIQHLGESTLDRIEIAIAQAEEA